MPGISTGDIFISRLSPHLVLEITNIVKLILYSYLVAFMLPTDLRAYISSQKIRNSWTSTTAELDTETSGVWARPPLLEAQRIYSLSVDQQEILGDDREVERCKSTLGTAKRRWIRYKIYKLSSLELSAQSVTCVLTRK